MKMLKKLLAIVLTGAMALTLLTACGSNAVTEKDIVDAMNEMVKAIEVNVTFTPRAKEREMAKAIAALSGEDLKELENFMEGGKNRRLPEKAEEILGIDAGGENKTSRFVWCGAVVADEIGATGQAYHAMNEILGKDAANADKLPNKKPADIRYIGTALGTLTIHGKQTRVRFIVVTAEAVNKK